MEPRMPLAIELECRTFAQLSSQHGSCQSFFRRRNPLGRCRRSILVRRGAALLGDDGRLAGDERQADEVAGGLSPGEQVGEERSLAGLPEAGEDRFGRVGLLDRSCERALARVPLFGKPLSTSLP